MITQKWELWKRDAQTLTVLSWSVHLMARLNSITKTYPKRTKFINGDEVMFRINICDLGKIEYLLGLKADYILQRINS